MAMMTYMMTDYYKQLFLHASLLIKLKQIAGKYKYNMMIGHDFFRLLKKKKIVIKVSSDKINIDNEYYFDNVEDAIDYITYIITEAEK